MIWLREASLSCALSHSEIKFVAVDEDENTEGVLDGMPREDIGTAVKGSFGRERMRNPNRKI